MRGEYPNLPLIEERFKNIPKVREILESQALEAKKNGDYYYAEFDCDVFSQTFPNTAGIFENGGMSGQAFTGMYITVIHAEGTDAYGVFGGNRGAYLIIDPSEEFFSDLQARHMEVYRRASSRYVKQEGEETNT